MQPRTVEQRLRFLEMTSQSLEGLPDAVAALSAQILQLTGASHDGLSALREEIRAGDEETRRVLREEIRAGDEETRRVLREEIRAGDEETRRYMRVLHEEVIYRISLIGESGAAH